MSVDEISLWIAGALAAAIITGLALIWAKVQQFTETLAAPRREKEEQDRTLTDKLIIEADKRADMLNIQQYEIFLQRFIAMHLPDIIRRAPIVGPLVVAGDYVDQMLESWRSRNPQTARKMNQSRTDAQEILAGEIGKMVKDKLTRDLLVAGAPAVEPRENEQ